MGQSEAAAWLDVVKDRVRGLSTRLQESRGFSVDIAIYGGIGFLSGFLLKKYSAYVALFVLLIVGLSVLHQFGVISITLHWDKVNELLGLHAGASVADDALVTSVWEWIKANMIITVSYVIGFLIGLNIG